MQALEGLNAEANAGAPGWTIAAGNLLRQTDQVSYAYDARKRRIGKLELTKLANGREPTKEDATVLAWDVRDRLREVRFPSGLRVKMTYDAFGRRVRKEVFSGEPGKARRVEFVWDGDALAADLDSEQGARCFVHAPGTLVPVLQEERGEVLAYVNDHLGMPKELVDANGLVAWSAAHSAFGKVVETYAHPTSELNHKRKVSSPFRLLGQYADEETGLCCTRFRYFDPEVGRWISPDPLGIEGGKDLFGFDGSPTLVVDPLGLAPDVFRGGSSLDVKKGEYKPRKEAGDQTGRGISLWNTSEKVEKFGGAYKVTHVPDTLEVAQRGQNKDHYEIIAKNPDMTEEEYHKEVRKVQLERVPPCKGGGEK